MANRKPLPIVAAILGLLAIVGIPAIKLLTRPGAQDLRDYQDYERKLDAVTDPKNARSEEQLKQIKESLSQLAVPEEYRLEWRHTSAARRHAEWLEDATALERAIDEVKRDCQELIDRGRRVLEQKNAANLPGRAKEVLSRAGTLPSPDTEAEKLIPGSKRLTYATVFQFPKVAELSRQWQKIKKDLEPLSKLQAP